MSLSELHFKHSWWPFEVTACQYLSYQTDGSPMCVPFHPFIRSAAEQTGGEETMKIQNKNALSGFLRHP